MTTPVVLQVDGHVATVTLNRPDKRNAVSVDMFEALIDAGQTLARDRRVRAVVLRGSGGTFCAGIDTSVFSDANIGGGGRMAAMNDSPANFFQRAAYVWRELPVPVIAAVDGVAYGAGLQIAMGADIRIAAADARFSIMEIRWGIIPDMALTQTMRHTVRLDHVKELAFTGRVIGAEEACHVGFVTRIAADPHIAAAEVAVEIAARSPHAVRALKQLLNNALDATPAEALELEARLQMTLLGQPNQREAVISNLEKREPRFVDLVVTSN